VHDVLVRHVRVGEDDFVDSALAHERLELFLRTDRDPVGIEAAGELGRVHAAVDVRDLCRGERDDVVFVAVAVDDVEVVEVSSCGAGDEDARPSHA
jgi:hypothetical protein